MKEKTQRIIFEQIKPIEVSVEEKSTLNSVLEDVSMFQTHVTKPSFFSESENDEFFVIRENGEKQGIFKTWAIPTIPFLEEGNLELFNDVLSKSSNLKRDIESIYSLRSSFKNWKEKNSKHPALFFETLEKWRSFSQIYDKRLTSFFQESKLPSNPDEKVAELFLRLFTAFRFSSSFYNIEAIVGDGNNTNYNPTSGNTETSPSGGSLDVVGMLLPSALPSLTTSEKLNWNGLSWNSIKDNLNKASSEELKVIFRIAKEIDVPMEDVVFAANVLEWIPVNVGGKKGDVDPEIARKMILDSLSANKINSSESVSRNVNALIRFLNWFPILKNPHNFEGTGWRYAAVCDTSSELVQAVQDGDFFTDDFAEIFVNKISPQVKNVDATSAKGRLMIQLLLEGRFKPAVYNAIRDRIKSFSDEVVKQLAQDKKDEYVVNIHDHMPRALVGGKSAGLREAGIVFGIENVVPGMTITSEAISDWLRSDKMLWKKIQDLNHTGDINKKIKLAKDIENKIKSLRFPVELSHNGFGSEFGELIIRSSSFDEDSDITGAAAGIYESVPCENKSQAPACVSHTISSFFSEKAVSFRSLHGLSDIPLFAVVINPLIKGPGGIAFSLNEEKGWEVVVAESPSKVADNHSASFDSFKYSRGNLNKFNNSSWVDVDTVIQVGQMVEKAESFLGLKVDIEFVVDKNNKIWVLQLRTLHKNEVSLVDTKVFKTTDKTISSLSDLETLKVNKDSNLNLHIGKDIDLNQFQGTLFRWLVVNNGAIKEITLPRRIPRTGHFANICLQLGIKLNFPNAK